MKMFQVDKVTNNREEMNSLSNFQFIVVYAGVNEEKRRRI